MSNQLDYEEISSNLEFLDDWEDRYRYLIELGEKLPPMDESDKIDDNKVNGCVSQVWLSTRPRTENGVNHIHMSADSDAMIVKGLVAVLMAYYSGKPAEWIAKNNVGTLFDELGLREHLTSQRANGLNAMIKKIRSRAREYI